MAFIPVGRKTLQKRLDQLVEESKNDPKRRPSVKSIVKLARKNKRYGGTGGLDWHIKNDT